MFFHLKEEFISCMKILRMWILFIILMHMKLQELLIFHYVNQASYLIITHSIYIGLKIRTLLCSTSIFLCQLTKSKTHLTLYKILYLYINHLSLKKEQIECHCLVLLNISQNILLRNHYLKISVCWTKLSEQMTCSSNSANWGHSVIS